LQVRKSKAKLDAGLGAESSVKKGSVLAVEIRRLIESVY